jgi:hypothetical protein
MKRRIEEDRKKALRVKEAEERVDQKEREKLQKSLEKSNKKGKRKMNLLNQKVRVQLLLVPHMNQALMLQHFLEEQNAIPPTNS